MRSTASQALPRRAACRRPAASRGPRRVQAREAPRSRPVSLWGVVSPGLNWSKMFHRSAQARASALARATGGRSPPRVRCARVPHPSLVHVPHPSRGHVPCRLPVHVPCRLQATSPALARPRLLLSRRAASWPSLLSRPPVVLTRIVSCPLPPSPHARTHPFARAAPRDTGARCPRPDPAVSLPRLCRTPRRPGPELAQRPAEPARGFCRIRRRGRCRGGAGRVRSGAGGAA